LLIGNRASQVLNVDHTLADEHHLGNIADARNPGQKITPAVERLLQVEVLVIENEQQVFTALVALKQGRGSFADVLIAERGARAGCTRTLTFDQKAVRLPGFELV